MSSISQTSLKHYSTSPSDEFLMTEDHTQRSHKELQITCKQVKNTTVHAYFKLTRYKKGQSDENM